jgi:hypothetical protein
MEWLQTPDSSNVAGFGYDSDNQVLTVEFKRGASYNYYDVPEPVFEGMRLADSKGRYLERMVKGTYRYARV